MPPEFSFLEVENVAAEKTVSVTLSNGVPVTLRFRAVKLFRISVKPDGSVEAVAPRRMSTAQAVSLAEQRAEWARAHRERFLRTAPPEYVSGERVRLWGEEYTLRVTEGRPGAALCGGEIVLSVPAGADASARRAAFMTLCRRELELALPPLVEEYAARLDVEPPRWSLRDMSTRYGSCTPARKTVRFALMLAEKPHECLEYVVAHELAHLRIHGHGPDFHALVQSVFPREREAAALLRARK